MTDRRAQDETDRTLGRVLEAEGRHRAPDRLLEDVFARTRETRQVRRRGWGNPWQGPSLAGRAAALIVAAALAVGALALLLGGTGAPLAPTPSPVAATPATSVTPLPTPAAVMCANGIGLGGAAPDLWVGCPASAQHIDTAVVPPVAGERVKDAGLPQAGGAGVWAIRPGGVAPLDPETGAGPTIAAPGVVVLTVGTSVIWGGTSDDTVVRIDLARGTVTGTIQVGAKPLALLEAGGRVWVAADDARVHAYDVATLAPGAVAATGSDSGSIGASASAVYVVSQGSEGTVTRVDLATGVVTSRRIADPTDPRSLGLIVVDPQGAGVWVTRRASLVQLQPTTLEELGSMTLPAYPAGIVLDGGRAWVYGEDGRLDEVALPRSGSLRR